MTGKILVGVMAAVALAVALSVYYLQVFYYYDRVTLDAVTLTTPDGETGIDATDIRAIDATSSPIRFRACFETAPGAGTSAVPYDGAVPLTAPFWFDCFDADAIGAALEDGTARAYLGTKNIDYGVDRIVAITDDGRGFVWHQLNNCGELAYDGTQIGEDCPPRED